MKAYEWRKNETANVMKLQMLLNDDRITMMEAARQMGISHVTLYKMVRRYNLTKARGWSREWDASDRSRPPIDGRDEREAELKPIGEWPAGVKFA